MKHRLLRPFVLAAAATLIAAGVTGCGTTADNAPPPSFTLGITGKTSGGQDYVFGLNVPLPTLSRKAAPAQTLVEPPLPEGNGSGKTPVLVSP